MLLTDSVDYRQVLYLIGFVLVGYILLVILPPSVVQRYIYNYKNINCYYH